MPTSQKTAVKNNPELWKKIQLKWKKSSTGGKAGQWNARKGQLAVQEYKRLGGTYKGPKKNNSLVKWTKENWGYVDNKPGNRYLPEAVRKQLTPAEKRITNLQKKQATKKGKQYAPYSKSVIQKMHKSKIL
jgi:hypothetical protein